MDIITYALAKKNGGGSGGGVLVVHETDATPTALDKTWKEIHDATLSSGAVIVDANEKVVGIVTNVTAVGEEYSVAANTDNAYYFTDTESGYPHIEEQY